MSSLTYPTISDGEYSFIISALAFILLTPSSYIFGPKGLIATSIVLTLACSFFYIWMLAMGSAFSNSNTSQSITAEHLLSGLLLASYFAFLSLGIHYLCEWFKGNSDFKMFLFPWLALLFLVPIANYAYSTYALNKRFYNFFETTIIIAMPKDLSIIVDELSVISSDKNITTTFNVGAINRGHGLDQEDQQYRNFVASRADILIPSNTHSIALSWYSLTEKKYYKDTFSVFMDKLEVSTNYNYDRYGVKRNAQSQIEDIIIQLQVDGNAGIYKYRYQERINLMNYFEIEFTNIEDEKMQSLNLEFEQQNDKNPSVFKHALLSSRRVFDYSKPLEYHLQFAGFSEALQLDIRDLNFNRFQRSEKFMANTHKIALPEIIKIKYNRETRAYLILVFDRKEIFKAVEDLKAETEVTIFITANTNNASLKSITISGSGQTIELKKWHIRDDD